MYTHLRRLVGATTLSKKKFDERYIVTHKQKLIEAKQILTTDSTEGGQQPIQRVRVRKSTFQQR